MKAHPDYRSSFGRASVLLKSVQYLNRSEEVASNSKYDMFQQAWIFSDVMFNALAT